MKTLRERIEVDLVKFTESVSKANKLEFTKEESTIFELSKMYAQDSKSWLDKGDLDTSFSSISYAHGLLDAILKIKHVIE